jgi:TolB-like protein
MSKRVRFSGALAAAALLPAVALAQGKIAVQAFSAKGVDASVASTLETSFCTALSEQGLDVICAEEVKAIVAASQRGLGFGTCEDEECLKNIAKAAEAARIVTGEVARLGDLFIMSVALIEPESNKVLARASERTKKVEDLLDKLTPLAKKLAEKRK